MNIKKITMGLLFALLAVTFVFAGGGSKKAVADYELNTLSMEEIIEHAKAEKSLNFYTWYWQEHWIEEARHFKDKYGITINVITSDQTANEQKAIAEKGLKVGTIDALVLGGQMIKSIMDIDLLYGPIKDLIPHVNKLDPNLLKAQEGYQTRGYVVPFHLNQTGFAYDPDRVDNPPQTWEEFEAFIESRPKEFGFNDPNKGGSGQSMIHTLIKELAGGLEKYDGDNDVDEAKVADWEKVWQWIDARRDNITFTVSNADSIVRMNDGELALAPVWDDDLYNKMREGTIFKRVKMYIPEFGMAGGGDTMGIPVNSGKKAAALLWISFLTSAESQQRMTDLIGSYPANSDVKPSSTNLSASDKQYALSWFPAAYKRYMNDQFTKQVLMTK